MVLLVSIFLSIIIFSIVPIQNTNPWYLFIFISFVIIFSYALKFLNNRLGGKQIKKVTEATPAIFIDSNERRSIRKIFWYLLIGILVSASLASTLAVLEGSARAQGEFIYLLPFPINFFVGIYFLALNFRLPLKTRPWNKRYIFEVLGSMFLMFSMFPLFAEELIMIPLLKLDYMNQLTVILVATLFYIIFFSRPLLHLIRGKY